MDEKQLLFRKQNEQRIRGLRLLDDDFMKMVFDDNIEAMELILNVFFDRYDMKVLSIESQKEIKNVSGHSVRFDIYAEDSEGKHYDIEIQRSDRGAGERRARFNSSMLDTKLLKAGQNANELPDAYVIFITENDVRGRGQPIYRFSRMDEKTHELFDDGSHIIYVNGAYKNDSDRIGQLMHDFRCVEADDMNNKILADKVRYFKETEGGREKMCKIIEDIVKEAEREAEKAGARANSIENAVALLKLGKLSFEEIAVCTRLTIKEVQELANGRNE